MTYESWRDHAPLDPWERKEREADQALHAEKACGTEVRTLRELRGDRDRNLRREVERLNDLMVEKAYRANRDRTGTREERRAMTAAVVRVSLQDQPTLVLPVSRGVRWSETNKRQGRRAA